jgi:hypothetical protein
VLAGLGAALVSGCGAHLPISRPKVGIQAVRLGWRWVPGTRMVWRTRIERHVESVTWSRAEDWAYTARDLDPSGIVHLEGRLVGFGASVSEDGEALPEARLADARAEARARTIETVDLDLRLSGPLIGCSAEEFGAALPHRLLGVHFPVDPVRPGESWSDAGLARAFEQVLPLDVEVGVDATATLRLLEPVADGWRATLSHVTRLQGGAIGPAVEIVATTVWDTSPGALRRREVEARFRPDGGGRHPIGLLRAVVERLEDR